MTKKKFISDYTERFWFYMLEWYTDSMAVEKMLGEVYDKVKRPKKSEYYWWCKKKICSMFPLYGNFLESRACEDMAEAIYKKYLSDSNGWDDTNTWLLDSEWKEIHLWDEIYIAWTWVVKVSKKWKIVYFWSHRAMDHYAEWDVWSIRTRKWDSTDTVSE